jgi:hypothetical protein
VLGSQLLVSQRINNPDDWGHIKAYANVLYAKEAAAHDIAVAKSEPWNGIDRRLVRWVLVDVDPEIARMVDAFQVTQMPTVARRTMSQWRARFRRVQLAARCASAGPAGYATWRAALDLEAAVPENVRGRAQLGRYRTPIAEVTGVPAGQYPPRVHLWEGLTSAPDLGAAVTALQDKLPSAS